MQIVECGSDKSNIGTVLAVIIKIVILQRRNKFGIITSEAVNPLSTMMTASGLPSDPSRFSSILSFLKADCGLGQ